MKSIAIIEPAGTGFSAVGAHIVLLDERGEDVPAVDTISFDFHRPSTGRTA